MVIVTLCYQVSRAISAVVSTVHLLLTINFAVVSHVVSAVLYAVNIVSLAGRSVANTAHLLLVDLAGFLEDTYITTCSLSSYTGQSLSNWWKVSVDGWRLLERNVFRVLTTLADIAAICRSYVYYNVLCALDLLLAALRATAAVYQLVTGTLAALPLTLAHCLRALLETLSRPIVEVCFSVMSTAVTVAESLTAFFSSVCGLITSTEPEALLGLALVVATWWVLRRLLTRHGVVTTASAIAALARLVAQLAVTLSTVVIAGLQRCHRGWQLFRWQRQALKAQIDDDQPPADSQIVDSEESDARLCVVCREAGKEVILLPCRHVCLCVACSGYLLSRNRHCPLCRTRVRQYMHVFL